MAEKSSHITELLLESRYTIGQIARMVGCSRQYVFEVAQDKHITVKHITPIGYMMPEEAAKQLGYSERGIISAIRSGKMKAEKIRGRWFIPKENPIAHSCIVCGKPVTKRRISTCSRECWRIRQEKLHANARWRNLCRLTGQRIEGSSIDYIRKLEKKSGKES